MIFYTQYIALTYITYIHITQTKMSNSSCNITGTDNVSLKNKLDCYKRNIDSNMTNFMTVWKAANATVDASSNEWSAYNNLKTVILDDISGIVQLKRDITNKIKSNTGSSTNTSTIGNSLSTIMKTKSKIYDNEMATETSKEIHELEKAQFIEKIVYVVVIFGGVVLLFLTLYKMSNGVYDGETGFSNLSSLSSAFGSIKLPGASNIKYQSVKPPQSSSSLFGLGNTGKNGLFKSI